MFMKPGVRKRTLNVRYRSRKICLFFDTVSKEEHVQPPSLKDCEKPF